MWFHVVVPAPAYLHSESPRVSMLYFPAFGVLGTHCGNPSPQLNQALQALKLKLPAPLGISWANLFLMSTGQIPGSTLFLPRLLILPEATSACSWRQYLLFAEFHFGLARCWLTHHWGGVRQHRPTVGKGDCLDVVELRDSNEIWREEEHLFFTGFSPCWISVTQEENSFFTKEKKSHLAMPKQ